MLQAQLKDDHDKTDQKVSELQAELHAKNLSQKKLISEHELNFKNLFETTKKKLGNHLQQEKNLTKKKELALKQLEHTNELHTKLNSLSKELT